MITHVELPAAHMNYSAGEMNRRLEKYDEAKKYAEMYPDNNGLSKDRVLLDCLQGEEKTKHYQKMLSNMLSEILNHISNYNFAIFIICSLRASKSTDASENSFI